MHSSRMRTVHSSDCISGGGGDCLLRGGLLLGRGVSAPGGVCFGGCVSARGVSAPGGCLLRGCVCLLPGGCLLQGGVCSQGVSAPGGVCSGVGWYPSTH